LAAASFGGVVRFVMIVVACGIALYLLWRVRGVVRLVGISLFFALALIPVVDALDNKIRLPRALLILLVYVLLLAGVAVIGYVVVPSLIKEVGQLSHDAPRYATELRHNGAFRHYDNRYHITATLVGPCGAQTCIRAPARMPLTSARDPTCAERAPSAGDWSRVRAASRLASAWATVDCQANAGRCRVARWSGRRVAPTSRSRADGSALTT
jgi:AI-2E family transporter